MMKINTLLLIILLFSMGGIMPMDTKENKSWFGSMLSYTGITNKSIKTNGSFLTTATDHVVEHKWKYVLGFIGAGISYGIYKYFNKVLGLRHALKSAARNGDLDCLNALLDTIKLLGVDSPEFKKILSSNSFGYALYYAAINGHLDCLNALIDTLKLLSKDSDEFKKIVSSDYFGHALIWAAKNGDLDCLNAIIDTIKLLGKDSDEFKKILSSYSFGWALYYAAENRQLDCLRAIIDTIKLLDPKSYEFKKILSSYDFGWALIWAAKHGHLDCLNALLNTIKLLGTESDEFKKILSSDYFGLALESTAKKRHYSCFVTLLSFKIEALEFLDIPAIDPLNEEEDSPNKSNLNNFIEKLKTIIKNNKYIKYKEIFLGLIDYFKRKEFIISGTLSRFMDYVKSSSKQLETKLITATTTEDVHKIIDNVCKFNDISRTENLRFSNTTIICVPRF